MAGLFQPKRVVVPGLLSDEGLAAQVKELTGAQKTTAEAAPPNTSALEFADQVTTMQSGKLGTMVDQQAANKARKAADTQKAEQIGDAIAGGVGAVPGVQQLGQIGLLSPERQLEEQQQLIKDAQQREQTLKDAEQFGQDFSQDKFGPPPDWQTLSPEELKYRQQQTLQQVIKPKLEAAQDVQTAKTTLPKYEWWRNAAETAFRSAASVGVDTLKFPADIWDLSAETITGQAGKSDVSILLDGIDRSLTKMLPGDPARSKEFVTELSQGVGSMTGFMIGGFATKALRMGAGVGSAVLGAAVEGNSLYEEADGLDAGTTQKWLALILGAGLGTTEAIPIDRAFFRADQATGGLVRQLLANSTASSLEEFTQELAQSAGEDLIAKYVYDENRDLDPGSWLHQAVIGGIVGAGAGTTISLIEQGGESREVEIAKTDDAALTAAAEESINAAQQGFDAALGDAAGDLPGLGGVVAAANVDAQPVGSDAAARPPQGEQAAGAQTQEARPDPVVAGDAVKQIVEKVKPAAQVSTAPQITTAEDGTQSVVLDPSLPVEQQTSVQVAPAIETPEFKKWFGQSKVVDEQGQPQVVYHGTPANFKAFDTDKLGRNTGADDPGIFFTSSREVADGFKGGGLLRKGKVLETYLALQNPREVDGTNIKAGSVAKSLILSEAQADGFDGVIFRNLEETDRRGVGSKRSDVFVAFKPTQIKSAISNDGSFDVDDPNIDSAVGIPVSPDIAAQIDAVQLEPHHTSPLPDIEKGLTGPIPRVVQAAKAYAAAIGLPHRRQRSYVKVDTARAARIANAYTAMKHEPNDPAVQAAYRALADETIAQYQYVKASGIKIETILEGQPDPYPNGPRDVLKDIAAGHIWYFPTDQGFGSSEFDPAGNPLLEATGEVSDNGQPMVVNDLFRVVHDFFGHGLEGTGFGPRGEENAWQSHMRLFTASAVPAMTSETRGQNSWVNYGPFGEQNRADPRNTTYADQKTGLMPEWTWTEGVVDSAAEDVDAPVELQAPPTKASIAKAREPSGIGAGYGDYVTYTDPSGGVLRIVERTGALRDVSVIDFVVPEESRNQGIGRALMERAMADYPSLMGQVSSRPAARLAYSMGRRPFDNPDATLDEIYALIERDSSVNLLSMKPNTSVQRFLDAFLAAKNASPFGAAVHAYTAEEYAQMRLFLAPDGLSGFALKGEDIVSVFSHPASGGGRARKIIDVAVANGGRTLDCFDGKLVQIYSALGFREVRRESWNDEFKPDGWKAEWGKPDVVFMAYGQSVERMEARADALAAYMEGVDSYFLNPDGSPRVFYHGSPKGGFREFDTKPQSAKTEGTGAWFTNSRDQAVTYSNSREDVVLLEAQQVLDDLLAKGATRVHDTDLVLRRTSDGLEIEADAGYGGRDTVADEGELREWLSDFIDHEGDGQASIYSVYLQVKKPLIVDWGGASWQEGPMEETWELSDPRIYDTFGGNDIIETDYDEDEARARAEAFLTELKEDNPGEFDDLEVDDILKKGMRPGYQSTDQFVRELRENGIEADGYDAIILQNVTGSGPFARWGSNETSDEIIIFDPRKVKSTANIGTYNPTDPDILRMTGTSTVRQPYALEPTRPTRGVPEQPGAEPNDVRLTQIASNLTKLLNLTVRHGRLVNKGDTMGEFNRRTGVVRLRTWTDLSTLAHEAGHAINDVMAAPLDAFVNSHLADFNAIARKLYPGDLSQATGATVRREGFAEFFRVYTMTPDYARNTWAQLTADFEALLDREDPQIRTGLNAIAAQVRAWQQLPSGRLIENTVIDGRREQGIGPAMKELRDLGFKTWMQELVRRNVQWSTNRYAALNRLVTELLNEGEQNRGAPIDLARADDPRTLIRLARNAGSRSMVQVTDGVLGYHSVQSMSRGLREAIMVSQGVDPNTTPKALDEERLHAFSAYLVARRALEEFRRFDAGELDRQPVAFSKGDAVRAVREWEAKYNSFADAAQIVHEYGMALWKKSYDAGLLSKETYEENLKRQFYAPLQRDLSDKRNDLGDSALTTRGSGPLRSIVRRFRGSDRDIIDPLAILMQKTFALDRLIAENDAKKALAVLADRVGQAGALVERVPAHQLMGQQFGVREVARQLTGLDDMSEADAADLMTLLDASIKDGDTISLFRSQQASAKGEPILFFWENGKVAAIQVKDGDIGADVVNTLNAVGRENMDKWLEGVAATSTVFRTAITSWPDFLLVNFVRDQLSAWILTDVGFKPFVTGFRGVLDEVRQKGWAKLYNASQGIMGGMNVAALHTARVDRDIRSLRAKGYVASVFGDVRSGWDFPNMIKGLARVSAVTETGTRLGLYRGAFERAKREGLDDYQASVEAAYTATDYIDFGLNGSAMLTTRRLIPFLNAQIQGLYKMVRTLGGDEVAQRKGLKFVLTAYFKNINNLPLSRTEKLQLRTGRKAWLKMMSLGLISAALYALWKDDPDYQEAGEYLRTTGWVIPLGNGQIFYIPKPFELAMVANAVERGLEAAAGDGSAIGRFLRGVAFNLSPPTSPPLFTLGFEVPNNIDTFTGREIVPSYMQALSPELQYDSNTSNIAKWMGSTFGWSPMVVDHVLSGLGASAYRDIATLTNAADPTRPSMTPTDAPLLRRFLRDVRRGSVSAQDFWSQASSTNGALARAAASYKHEIEAGNEPAANRRLASMTADQRAYAVLMTHFKVEEKRLNPFYRATQITTLVSKMRREIASSLSLGDTTIKDSTDTIPLTARKKRDIDTILSEISRREVRNTLIATGQPGWADKEVLPVEPTIDMLLAISPEAYDEFQRRWRKAKVYDAQTVYDYWPDVRDRLVQDGEFAILKDAVAVASAGL